MDELFQDIFAFRHDSTPRAQMNLAEEKLSSGNSLKPGINLSVAETRASSKN